MKKEEQWENWLNLLLGVWLLLTPALFSFQMIAETTGTVAMWNYGIVGILTILFSFAALRDMKPWEEWVNLVIGAWLVLSPWILAYSVSSNLMWNSLICGALIIAFSGYAIPIARRKLQESQGPGRKGQPQL